MGGPVTNAPASIARSVASQPYASLLVCAAFIALQVGAGFLVMLITLESDGNGASRVALYGAGALLLLLPLGSLYGIYLARPSSGYGRAGGWLRGLGLLANILYLMIGMFLWLIVLSGIRV